MANVVHALRTFFEHLAAISWRPLLLALLFQLTKTAARARAQRNVLAAAYPESEVRWRSVLGAYLAGAGVNAFIPIRGGDLLRLYLLRHRIADASYPTLVSSLLVEVPFDMLASLGLLVWAVKVHALPGLQVARKLPAVDWFWLFRYPRAALAVAVAALLLGFALGLFAAGRVASFRRGVRQGFAILRTPGLYVRSVVSWQMLDWTLRIATIWFFLDAFHIQTSLDSALRVQVTQSLSTILPLTPAGIGTEQALITHVLSGRASSSALLSFSVGMKLVLSVWSVILGAAAILLMARTLRWRRLLAQDQPAAREPLR